MYLKNICKNIYPCIDFSFVEELPIKIMDQSEKLCTKQIHIHYFTEFYLNSRSAEFTLGKRFVTMQTPVANPQEF